MTSRMTKWGALVALLALTACSSRPKLYPNKKLERVGKEVSEKDIDDCMAKADAYLEGNKGKQVAKGAGKGAVVGGAVGAVGGLFGGGVAKGALMGGALGGTAGGAGAAVSPDRLKHNYVNRCLSGKGYEVIGWD